MSYSPILSILAEFWCFVSYFPFELLVLTVPQNPNIPKWYDQLISISCNTNWGSWEVRPRVEREEKGPLNHRCVSTCRWSAGIPRRSIQRMAKTRSAIQGGQSWLKRLLAWDFIHLWFVLLEWRSTQLGKRTISRLVNFKVIRCLGAFNKVQSLIFPEKNLREGRGVG